MLLLVGEILFNTSGTLCAFLAQSCAFACYSNELSIISEVVFHKDVC